MAILSSILEWMSLNRRNVVVVFSIMALIPLMKKSLAFWRWFVYNRKMAAAVHDLPGPEAHWLLGHLREIPTPGEKTLQWITDYARKYPKINKFFITGFRPIVSLNHPDTVKEILKTSEPKSISSGGGYGLLRPWLGDGLLVSSGDKWFRNRRLLTPGFHFDVLKPYMDIYNDAADRMIAKWMKLSHDEGSSIEIYKPVSLCTLDVMLRCAFSYESDIQASDNKYVNTVNTLAELTIERVLKPWLLIDWIYYKLARGKLYKKSVSYAHKIAYELIDKRLEALKANPDTKDHKYVDFLDILLLAKDEKGEGLTREEIRHEVDTFLFEGHDTTASAISWILYALAKHPDIQQKCREEVQALSSTNEQSYRLQWDDLQELPYLTQCIKESLRLNPPVTAVMRELTQITNIEGFRLLPQTEILVRIFGVHHNPLVWGPDHNEFKPERFHPDNMSQMDSHAFIPFSAGPRNCIGQNFALHEIKVIVSRVLQQFELNVDEEHQVERLPLLVMRARSGIKLFLSDI